mmetsp:Transcript_3037/g.12272  ORF Transcript_3037/g.12272 Transcript_3037/m.12272 type:complete len:205 (-) Transcript_3037:1112-1726(-)
MNHLGRDDCTACSYRSNACIKSHGVDASCTKLFHADMNAVLQCVSEYAARGTSAARKRISFATRFTLSLRDRRLPGPAAILSAGARSVSASRTAPRYDPGCRAVNVGSSACACRAAADSSKASRLSWKCFTSSCGQASMASPACGAACDDSLKSSCGVRSNFHWDAPLSELPLLGCFARWNRTIGADGRNKNSVGTDFVATSIE